MRVTIFERDDDRVTTDVRGEPAWQPQDTYDGKPLSGVRLDAFARMADAELQLVEIAAGGHFAMHSSPDVAFCQIVRGRGRLRLPDGRDLPYEGPELYVFLPDTLHEWHAVTEDTLLSVCIVAARQQTG